MSELSTDYLIVGGGASGLAFADTLLDETDAQITIVDRRDKPGGHWNDAYPFVRLHQPSSFYGVASKELSSFSLDETGFNKGFEELASGQDVVAYFHDLVERKFLPSGRVRFLPMCEYRDGKLRFAVSGETANIHIRRKLVDATYYENSIPLTHSRQFEWAKACPVYHLMICLVERGNTYISPFWAVEKPQWIPCFGCFPVGPRMNR